MVISDIQRCLANAQPEVLMEVFGEVSEDIVKVLKEMLEKEHPKKPVKNTKQKYTYITLYHCPACGIEFPIWLSQSCGNCGQSLDIRGIE